MAVKHNHHLLIRFASALCALVVMLPVLANKQLVINEQHPCDLEASSAVAIESATGNVKVQVADLQDCIGGGLSLSPVLSSPQPVEAGSSVEILWASANAEECTPTGDLPGGWSGRIIGLQGPETVSVPTSATPGQYSAGVECTRQGEDPLNESTLVEVVAPDVGSPPNAPSLTVNGSSSTTIDPGDDVDVVWSSSSATSCSASGSTLPGWSGSKPTSGSLTVTTSGSLLPGQYVVRLRCSNSAGDSPWTTRTVNVADPGAPGCENRPPPPGMTRAAIITTDNTKDGRIYSSVFNATFPGTSNTQEVLLNSNTYAALQFSRDSIPSGAKGQINVNIPQGYAQESTGFKLWSISTCPGDFDWQAIESDPNLGPGCIKRDALFFTESFTFGGSSFRSDETRCALNAGVTYYLNFFYNTQPEGTPVSELQWNCAMNNSVCGNAMNPGNFIGWD